jgi:hypothetical protein
MDRPGGTVLGNVEAWSAPGRPFNVGSLSGMSHVFPQPERQQLLDDIEAAFGDTRLAGGVSLHQARAIDDYEGADKIAEARKLDSDERWQDISDATIDELNDTLLFLDAEGFRFYIPRFIVYVLTHAGDGTGSWAVDGTIYTFQYKEDEAARYSLLSPEQRRVIARFLRGCCSVRCFCCASGLVSAYGERASEFGRIALRCNGRVFGRVASPGCSVFCSPRSLGICGSKVAVSEHSRSPRRLGCVGQALVARTTQFPATRPRLSIHARIAEYMGCRIRA